jgi:hypothetical protein
LKEGRTVAASVSDHITPHNGNPILFEGELQSLCAHCHNNTKRKHDLGITADVDVDGFNKNFTFHKRRGARGYQK